VVAIPSQLIKDALIWVTIQVLATAEHPVEDLTNLDGIALLGVIGGSSIVDSGAHVELRGVHQSPPAAAGTRR
jgi:hypothetical protein